MPLSPQEQRELEALEQEVGGTSPFAGLSEEEQAELEQLEQEVGATTTPPAGPQSAISEAEAAARGAAQGFTFGFSDELAGVAGAISEGDYANFLKHYRRKRDEARREHAEAQEVHPKSYLAGEVAGGIVGAFVPGLGWVGSGGKAAVAASKAAGTAAGTAAVKAGAKAGAVGGAKSGAVYGAGKAEELEDVPGEAIVGAGVGAAGGAALGAVFTKAGQYLRNKQQIEEAGTQAVQADKPFSDDVLDAMGRSETPIDMQLVEELIEQHPKAKFPGIERAARDNQFVLAITGKKSHEKVDDALRQKAIDIMHADGPERLQLQWITRKVKGDALAEAAERAISDKETAHQLANLPSLKSLAKTFIDPVQFAGKVDDRTGVPLARIMDKMHERANLASVETAAMMDEVGRSLKVVRWPKGDDKKIELIRAIEDPKQARTQASKKLKSVFDKLRNHFNENHGMQIDELTDIQYIPRYAADRMLVRSRMNKRLNKFDRLADTDQAKKDVLEAAHAMNIALGHPERTFTSADQIRKVMGEWVQDKGVHETLTKNMTNAMMRKSEGLPILMRETDPARLVMRYLQGNTRAAYMMEPMAEMQNAIRALDILNQHQARDYFQKYLADMASASGSNLESLFQRTIRNPWMQTVDKLMPEDSVLKDNIKYLPDLLDWSSSNVYANLMGWRLDAPLRNMSTQPFFLSAPELTGGDKYGYKLIGKAYGKMVKDIFTKSKLPFSGQVGHMEEQLRKNGIQAAQHNLEAALPAFENGVRSVPGIGHMVKAIDKMSELGMWLYTKSDTINRYITMNATHELVEEMAKKNVKAINSIKHWPASVRHDISRALQANRVEEAKKVAAMYMNNKTQFVYSKEGLNEAGRDYGRFISMFTKWPVNISTEAAYALHDKQRRRMVMANKLFGPALGMFAINKGLEEMDALESPAGKLLFGKSVLAWDPMESLPLTGELTPPALQVAGDLYEAADAWIEKDDSERALEKGLKALEPFIAVYGGVKAVRRRDNVLSEALDNLGVEE
jgi:hypothetical protein